MNPYLLSFVLGIIEGLTEFLPVSSTAHLRVAESLLGNHFGLPFDNAYWKMFTLVIQLGAILCLPIYFGSRIAKFLSTFPQGERGDRTAANHPLTLVLIAFVVTAIPAWLLHKKIGENLDSLKVMGWALLIGGVVMWLVDAAFGRPSATGRYEIEHMEELSMGRAIWIGFCQIFSAVFPGTSRSMSTIAAGQLAGMSRASALEFSFFLSMPTMTVATAYELLKTLRSHGGTTALGRMPIGTEEWVVLLIGFVVSFFVAWGVVAWFMNWVRNRGFAPFAVYRIILGIVVLMWLARI